MLTHYYHFEKSIKQIHAGPAGLYLDGFAAALWEDGYSEISARRHIRAAQHLVYWAQQQHVLLAKIDDVLVERFRRHLRQCRCRHYGSSHPGGLVKGAHLFLGHLESINVIPTRVKINQKPEAPALLYSFRQWMRSNRNIGEATLYNYSLAVGDLLQTLGENPSHFDVQKIGQFVIDRNRRCGRAKVQNMVTALRAFVRYLINLV